MLDSNEKEYLRTIVKRELDSFRKKEKLVAMDAAVKFLKAEHEYGHFLEKLLERLK